MDTITDTLEYSTSSDSKETPYYAGHHNTKKMPTKSEEYQKQVRKNDYRSREADSWEKM